MEKLKDTLCCGQPASIEPAEQNGKKGWGIFCSTDHEYGIFGEDRESVIRDFLINARKGQESSNGGNKVVNNNNNRSLVISAGNMPSVFEDRKEKLAIIASPILSGDKSAMERLMLNNTERYPLGLTGKAWDKVWKSPEGQQSIVKGIEDALIMGAELGKMGDLVPMGTGCTFIPSVEAFEFTLTNGNNAPFAWIMIECIYQNDEYSSGSKMGSFFFENKHGKPRGEVIGAVAYGELSKRGIVIGEIYDADRLMKSAEAHSTSYQYYLRDKKQFQALHDEGKTLFKNGREYFVKDMGTWQKDIFIDELSNPYDSDRAKMFMKATGKSFFAKFIKVRNSEAAMEEVKSSKSAVKQTLDMADSQFEDIKDVTGDVEG